MASITRVFCLILELNQPIPFLDPVGEFSIVLRTMSCGSLEVLVLVSHFIFSILRKCFTLEYGFMQDLWKLTITEDENYLWTWVSGSQDKDVSGIFGARGTLDHFFLSSLN